MATAISGSPSVATDYYRVIDENGIVVDGNQLPEVAHRLELYRRMVLGRRFNEQATIFARQGKLAVYASSRGQEACQVGAALALDTQDWLFPTYRDSVAVFTRGVDPVEVLSYTRGFWHIGHDPYSTRVAPLCSPLATHVSHAVGLAHAARLRGDNVAVLVMFGDGATSEGDAHEALNFAGVLGAPVVFLIQNNGYAISVPVSRQTRGVSLAQRAAGYGIPGESVDGNDVIAVETVLARALAAARSGEGPRVVEARTVRLEPHTNADDAMRYQPSEELESWRRLDPLIRLAKHLTVGQLLDQETVDAFDTHADELAADLRERIQQQPTIEPAELFEHVYTAPTAALERQRDQLMDELARESEP